MCDSADVARTILDFSQTATRVSSALYFSIHFMQTYPHPRIRSNSKPQAAWVSRICFLQLNNGVLLFFYLDKSWVQNPYINKNSLFINPILCTVSYSLRQRKGSIMHDLFLKCLQFADLVPCAWCDFFLLRSSCCLALGLMQPQIFWE